MTFSGLKTVVKNCLFLSCFCLVGLNGLPCQAAEGIAPDRNISVVVSEPITPDWKVLWDKARNHARMESYAQAASLYSTLLTLKPNIEEAGWEYCRVLLKLEDYAAVKKIISSLLEKNPERSEYLLAGGQIAVHDKDWTLAAKYYGKVLEKDPAGELADTALLGLTNSLKAQGRKEAAFTLLEQLIARKPRQANLLQEGALAAQHLGHAEKARKLYARLLAVQEVDDRILFSAANAFDSPGYEQQSSALWTEYLKRHPDYLPFRRKLAEYHLHGGDFEAAIPHVTYLAEQLADNDYFLLQAGTINLHQLRRPDKALHFLERYFAKHPTDVAVQQQIENIQSTLAHDFLAIVENDGASLLWNDLARITPHRAAIYLDMADLLEKQGKMTAAIEVLTIIHHHSPGDDSLALRIAEQYYRIEQYGQALGYLDKVRSQANKTKPYYTLRGNIQKILGMEVAALASFEAALGEEPGDKELRKTCLVLAGKIGLAGRMELLFSQGLKNDGGRLDHELFLTYLAQLSGNFLFRQYEETGAKYSAFFGPDPRLSAQLDLMKATALRREGKNRKAEQLLRKMLVEGRLVKEVLFALVDNAIADRNIEAARTWYKTLVQHTVLAGSEFSPDEDGYQRLLRKARLLKISGEYETARTLVGVFENDWRMKSPGDNHVRLPEALRKELCWLMYYLGDYKGTLAMVQSLDQKSDFDPELYVLHRLLIRKMKLPAATGKDLETKLAAGGNPMLARILDVIDSELVYEQYEMVETHLQTVLKNCPESVTGNIFAVRYFLAKGRFDEAVERLTKLIDTFPNEPYFTKKLIEMEVKRGRYDRGIERLGKWAGGISDVNVLAAKISSSEDTEEILTLARLLWGDKQHEKSLQLYQQLLSPTVLELLSEIFRKEQINYRHLTRDKSFWDSMMLLLQSEPEVITELMEPEFLVDNLANEAGSIVAAHYEMYSWQKTIANEYHARKAVFERNYSSAEQSYKRLLDEEKTTEGMIDLAAVYGRVGKYRKEAQVYEAIQNTGTTSPELANSIERSSIQMSPQNIFDVGYEEKDGRNGLIDMAKLSMGSSFWFTPDLNKDIRLVYANNRYESLDSSASAGSNLLYGSTIYEFAKDYELIFGGGTEKLDGTSDARFLYKMVVKGQLDQHFNAYLEWQKSLVYDTVMAIKEDISRQGIETGLTCETPLGLNFGGDFRHLNYSDGNSQNRFHGFSSYGLYGEAMHLALRYDYQYLNNADANPADLQTIAEENSQEGKFYWSPESFSEHVLTLHFQHDFLGYQQGEKRGVSYYSIDNAVGSETDEIISYMGKFNIFLEMNPHFLLKGNFTFAKSEDFAEKGLSISLHYRW